MGDLTKKFPKYTIDQLKVTRANAMRLLDDSKRSAEAHRVLDAIEAEILSRTLPGMISTFKEYYSGGFYGDRYAGEERDYKVQAVKMCQNLFAKDDFHKLLESEDWEELSHRFKSVLKSTNFLHPTFERARWVDAVSKQEYPLRFYLTLYELLHADSSFDSRFSAHLESLEEIGFLKWTSATYFLFLFNPGENMFVKPEMLKKSLEKSEYPLEYDSTPTPGLYHEIVTFSQWLFAKIHELEPRDLIDVHSFMWHMAPTGIHSEV